MRYLSAEQMGQYRETGLRDCRPEATLVPVTYMNVTPGEHVGYVTLSQVVQQSP